METVHISNFRDLLAGHSSCEIVNPLKGNVVRKLSLVDGNRQVAVDAISAVVTVDLMCEVRFEPWVLDRGNLLFTCEGYPSAKLCTEDDVVRYPDGSEALVRPAVR